MIKRYDIQYNIMSSFNPCRRGSDEK